MAITDKQLLFSEDQSCIKTASATPFVSTNVYDQGPLHADNVSLQNMGEGETLYFWWRCTTNFAAAASTTLRITLVSDDLVGGHDTSSVIHCDTGQMDISTAGTPLNTTDFGFIPLPPRGLDGVDGGSNYERYLAALLYVETDDSTAGAISCGICSSTEFVTIHASGLNFG